jgi:FeS assembly SUF system protein
MVTKEKIIKELKEVYDPEIPINVVDLGLIYGVDVKGNRVHIKMTLTSPHCPAGMFIQDNVKKKIESIKGIKKVEVEMIWDPPWSPERISKEFRKQLNV